MRGVVEVGVVVVEEVEEGRRARWTECPDWEVVEEERSRYD